VSARGADQLVALLVQLTAAAVQLNDDATLAGIRAWWLCAVEDRARRELHLRHLFEGPHLGGEGLAVLLKRGRQLMRGFHRANRCGRLVRETAKNKRLPKHTEISSKHKPAH